MKFWRIYGIISSLLLIVCFFVCFSNTVRYSSLIAELRRTNDDLARTNTELKRLNTELNDKLGRATELSRDLAEGVGRIVSDLATAYTRASTITDKAERVVVLSRAIVETIRRSKELSERAGQTN